jgi:hypothetical protein
MPRNSCASSLPCKDLSSACPETRNHQGCLKTRQRGDHSECTCTRSHRKTVSFDSIRILEFPPELGDNPSVSTRKE